MYIFIQVILAYVDRFEFKMHYYYYKIFLVKKKAHAELWNSAFYSRPVKTACYHNIKQDENQRNT